MPDVPLPDVDDSTTQVVYRRLWTYVTPYKLAGAVAVLGMASTALIEAGLVYLLEPLMDQALVARNLESAHWLPIAFVSIFFARGLSLIHISEPTRRH